MITFALRQRVVLVATVLAAALLPSASASATAPAAPHSAPAAHAAPANSCPRVDDRLFAAADQRADVARITPTPAWRTNCKQLYRADSRPPSVVFAEGFHPRATLDGQYDIERYVLVNQPSPYVSTTYDHDLYKTWWKSGWNYYIDAPGGVDVNQTIGDTHKWASQVEVAFPGGIERSFIVAVCPVDKTTKTEIMNECQDNPYYQPWRENFPG